MTKQEKDNTLKQIARVIEMNKVFCKNFPDNAKFVEELKDAEDAYKVVEAEKTDD